MASRLKIFIQLFVDLILWLLVCLALMFMFLRGKPVERGFVCDDPALSYPYVPDTIPPRLIMIVGFGTPVIVILLVEFFNGIETRSSKCCKSKNGIIYCVKGYAVFLVGFVVQETVVNSLKNELGELRPDFFDVCRPKFNKSLCPGYITDFECTARNFSEDVMLNVHKSFPSGHCSFTMYIATFYCIYIEKRLKIRFSRTLKFFLQSGLLFLSLSCGLERLQENRHHIHDILIGFFIGAVVAFGVYFSVMDEPKRQLCSECDAKLHTHHKQKGHQHSKELQQRLAVKGTNIYLTERLDSVEFDYESND